MGNRAVARVFRTTCLLVDVETIEVPSFGPVERQTRSVSTAGYLRCRDLRGLEGRRGGYTGQLGDPAFL